MFLQPVTHIQEPTQSRGGSQPGVSEGAGAEGEERTDEASPSAQQEQLVDLSQLQVMHPDTLTPAGRDKRFLTARVPLKG